MVLRRYWAARSSPKSQYPPTTIQKSKRIEHREPVVQETLVIGVAPNSVLNES